jgi:hypothetical protein
MARFPGETPWLSRPAPPPDPDREARIQEARRRALQDILAPAERAARAVESKYPD